VRRPPCQVARPGTAGERGLVMMARVGIKTVRACDGAGVAGMRGGACGWSTAALGPRPPCRVGGRPRGWPRRGGGLPSGCLSTWMASSRGDSLRSLARLEVAPQLPWRGRPLSWLAFAHCCCRPQRGASRPGGEPAPFPPGLASRLKAHTSPCPSTSPCRPRSASQPAALRFAPSVLSSWRRRLEEARLRHLSVSPSSPH